MKRYLSMFLALAVLAACQKEEPLLPGPSGDDEQEENNGNGNGDNSGNGNEGDNKEDVVPPATAGYAWFELPVITDADKNGKIDDGDELYYAYHLCAGGERSGGKTARNYTVCYSGVHHCPMWVAAPRHDMYVGGSGRTDAYQRDPDIPADIQYSSKSTGGGCNKGHMLGSAERTSSKPTNQQVFYYTNIAPQYSDTFNNGGAAWNALEEHVDGLVCADTLYEVVGCYFEKYTDAYNQTCDPKTISFGGRTDVSCPTMFYYAVLRTKSGNTGKSVLNCSASELKCAAFVLRHNIEKSHKPQAKDIISIEELEKITGFTYFPNVPNAPKGTVNTSDWL
ncbi:MAG: DNA/RNA non-specific endonuclease [Candidatus Cryptobacteroides sp.]